MSDAVANKSTYLSCKEPPESPPCQVACPVGIDIPRHLRFISQGQFAEALAVLLERLPFPSVCGRVCTAPCELKCRLGDVDGAMPIRALKRFVAEKLPAKPDRRAAKSTGKRVAIVGSGPTGLTAAYYLARLGHRVTVFEALDEPGGMMRFGIPDYRLPKDVLAAEIEAIKAVGVDIKTNTKVSSIAELLGQGYAAIFLAVGAHKPVRLGIEGEDSPGVIDAISLLKDINRGEGIKLRGRVAVIGGGNAAIDAGRIALRIGAKDVIIIYRRSREEMPAYSDGVDEALFEGVRIEFLAAPVRITGVNGGLRMECIRTRLGEADDSGRRRPEPIPGTEFSVNADTVLTAIGQVPDIPGQFGLQMTKDGAIETSAETLETAEVGVFAGGDAVTGPASVIEAVAAGRKAASSIDRYLGGTGDIGEVLVPPEEEVAPLKPLSPVGRRVTIPSLSLDERLDGLAEVEIGLNEQVAVEQATRCLRCDLPIICDASKCSGCMTCMLRCSFRFDGIFNLSTSRIQVRRLVDSPSEFEVDFTEDCDGCGICVRYCPYGALTRQKAGKVV